MIVNKAFSGRVFFDHLPKTAGTAISEWLRESLGLGCVTPTHLWGNHRELIRQWGGMYSVICAHAHFKYGEELDPRYQYVTFFRDPIDRAISWLYFIINNHHENDPLLGSTISQIRCFFESEGQDIHPDLMPELSNIYIEHFCRIKGTGLESDEEKLVNAFNAIKEYDVVGVFDNMPQFLADVAGLIGLTPPEEIKKVHVTIKRPQLDSVSQKIRERIESLNQLDQKLYAEIISWKKELLLTKQPKSNLIADSIWVKYEPVTNRTVITKDLKILDAGFNGFKFIKQGQLIIFNVDFQLSKNVDNLEMGIHIYDGYGRLAFGITNRILGQMQDSLLSGIYRVSYHLVANLPTGNYTAGFSFAEYSLGNLRELAWRDVMCDFEIEHSVNKEFAGYTYLPSEISLTPKWLSLGDAVVVHPSGSLLVSNSISHVGKGSQTEIEVEIINKSEQRWKGDDSRPVNLSYHWMTNSGEEFAFDGLRTPLPAGGVGPHQSLHAKMLVEAPSEAGSYILVLTLVQEYVAWFEERGFDAAQLAVEVS